jgi:hypothetical protein
VRPCSLVHVYDHLERTKVKEKMMVVGSCLSLISIYQTTWRLIQKDVGLIFLYSVVNNTLNFSRIPLLKETHFSPHFLKQMLVV